VEKQKGFHYGYLIVAAGIAMCIGPSALAFSCAGIFYTPVSTALGVGRGAFALYMTIISLTMAVFLPFAGKMLAKLDARLCLSAATIAVGGAIIAMSFFTEVWHFYIAGVFIGLGEAFLIWLAVPTLINRWFKKNAGFFLGLCMAFTGIGGVIFNPVGGALIASGPDGWRTGYLVFGILAIVISLPFTLFVVRSFPSDKGVLPYGESAVAPAADTSASAAPAAAPKLSGVTASIAMRSATFYAIALFSGLVNFASAIAQYLPSYASSFAESAPAIAALAAIMASSSMAGQAIGKVLLGFINDRKIVVGLMTGIVCGIVGVLGMWFVPLSAAVMVGGSFVFGIFYASCTVNVPLIARESFGAKDYTNIYSRISMVGSLVGAFAATGWGFIIDGAGFTVFWGLGLGLMGLAAVIGLFALGSAKKLVHTTD
jgi:MFS family permease